MNDQAEAQPNNFVELAADLVAAYVSNNNVPVSELPKVLASVHAALSGLGNAAPAESDTLEKPTPAQIKKSVTPDALISFIDGKPYKTLKRHLTGNGLTMHEYRKRYGLPSDYPTISATYSAQRSELARSIGLGQQRRKAAPNAVEAPEAAPKARGRKKA
ncbi:MucR family transcriptional regulator [Methylobacterium sp. HMF5984]|uniref:MucR family transcriptional regulator n=1 Tax=Methylobacterium sp. HMF5984 TaxID=3367370 RepID=UPI003852CD4C